MGRGPSQRRGERTVAESEDTSHHTLSAQWERVVQELKSSVHLEIKRLREALGARTDFKLACMVFGKLVAFRRPTKGGKDLDENSEKVARMLKDILKNRERHELLSISDMSFTEMEERVGNIIRCEGSVGITDGAEVIYEGIQRRALLGVVPFARLVASCVKIQDRTSNSDFSSTINTLAGESKAKMRGFFEALAVEATQLVGATREHFDEAMKVLKVCCPEDNEEAMTTKLSLLGGPVSVAALAEAD